MQFSSTATGWKKSLFAKENDLKLDCGKSNEEDTTYIMMNLYHFITASRVT